eukprot:3021849-Prymnesium_polylepis.1
MEHGSGKLPSSSPQAQRGVLRADRAHERSVRRDIPDEQPPARAPPPAGPAPGFGDGETNNKEHRVTNSAQGRGPAGQAACASPPRPPSLCPVPVSPRHMRATFYR